MSERIVIASDHAAVEMKAMLVAHLQAAGHEVVDLGPQGVDSVDYPDYGYKIAEAIADGRAAAWHAWCGLVRRGKDPLAVGPTGLAFNATR